MFRTVRTLPTAALLCGALVSACAPGSTEQAAEPRLDVLPATAQVTPGSEVTFAATSSGATVSVSWSIQEGARGGSISAGGTYTAPAGTGIFHVVATSTASPGVSGAAEVTVTAAPVVQVTILQRSASVAAGNSVTFTATVTGTANTGVTWSVQEGTGGGAISGGGVYTAPSTPGTYHVVATSVADPTKFDTVPVTVSSPPPVSVAIQPTAVSVPAGGQFTFTATVSNATNGSVTWSVAEASGCGSVTSGGAYTAPSTPGTCHVVATSVADPTKSASATVTVSAAPADLAAQLAILAGRSIYFGHRSVGQDIMTGVRHLLTSNAGAEPAVVTTSNADSMGPGVWAEALNGTNFQPTTKIDAFKASIQGGVGAKVDIAFFKFCWVDFNTDSDWFATGGSPDGLFARYRDAMTTLKTAFPGVTFVHVTSPLFAVGYDSAQYARNAEREQYNALLRSTYGGVEPVFDLALLESTDPSGNRVIGTSGPALYAGYTYDGGHLNATAQDQMAAALIALLASLP